MAKDVARKYAEGIMIGSRRRLIIYRTPTRMSPTGLVRGKIDR